MMLNRKDRVWLWGSLLVLVLLLSGCELENTGINEGNTGNSEPYSCINTVSNCHFTA
jgi:hypothetical protein